MPRGGVHAPLGWLQKDQFADWYDSRPPRYAQGKRLRMTDLAAPYRVRLLSSALHEEAFAHGQAARAASPH
jgi:hypothetical protein